MIKSIFFISQRALTVRPRKWWYWITRFRQIKMVERLVNYWWKESGEEKLRKAFLELTLFGNAVIKVVDDNKKEIKNETK